MNWFSKDNRPKKNFGGNAGENQPKPKIKRPKKGNDGGSKQTGRKPK